MQKAPMTVEGEIALREELHHLIKKVRPTIIESIATAREHGDLKENAEYHAAREQQSFIEGRITQIESRLAGAVIIDDLESVIELADDDDITAPHIDQLKAEANLESNLEELLKTGEISLEPNFFKVTDEDGQVRETFNLAFQVKAV